MTVRKPTPRQHALGIALSIAVAILWVGSSEMIQFIFGEAKFHQPFFLTYLTTSLFSVLLVGFLRSSWRAKLHAPSARIVTAGYNQVHTTPSASPAAPDMELVSYSLSDETSPEKTPPQSQDMTFNVRDVAFVAATIGPLYMGSNYIFNVALGLTSVSSSSTISTLSVLFTLAISSVAGVEKFSVSKLVASLMTIAGTAIVGRMDGKRGDGSLFGDGLAICAAFIYATYTTSLKYIAGDDDRVDLSMMFGFIGLFACLGAWPGLPLLNFMKWEPFVLPSWRVLGLLCLNAAVGSVLSDYLWAKSVVLTSALVGSVGMSLTVPLSILFDYYSGKIHLSLPYVTGALLVIAGYIIVNVELEMDKNDSV